MARPILWGMTTRPPLPEAIWSRVPEDVRDALAAILLAQQARIEQPERPAVVTEYQGHARVCPCCHAVTREPIPAGIRADAFGPRLAAALNMLSACQHVSVRGLEEVAGAVLGVPISLGGVAGLQ